MRKTNVMREFKEDFIPDAKSRFLFWGGFLAVIFGFFLLYKEFIKISPFFILGGYVLIGVSIFKSDGKEK